MKNIIIVSCILIILAAGFFAFGSEPEAEEGYLRIHIRANSNLEIDQDIKYIVKEYVVSYLTPLVSESRDANEAMRIISRELSNISAIASGALRDNGFNYTARAKLTEEYFPTRTYNELTLNSGYYDALIINLGEGAGNNWWCVIYPPLCFISGGNQSNQVYYKSKILEWLRGK